MSQDTKDFGLAVQAIWTACGEKAPIGDDLVAAAITFRKALELGRTIPRVTDKTFQPLVGPRPDIER